MLRFAPSPTGLLHVGHIKIALLNYIYSINHNLPLILRIDDTDIDRSKSKYVDILKEDLEWLGIKYTRCYHQSEQDYTKEIEFLKSIGKLYPCYETPEEIENQRKMQQALGHPPRYQQTITDNTRQPHWRFKLNAEIEEEWNDQILGSQKHSPSEFSDPVVIREDNVVLYNMASAIDDHRDQIKFILRGSDHVCNTVTQIQILRALRDQPNAISRPDIVWAHTPLMTNAKGVKFSKRESNQYSIQFLRYQGYDPLTLIHALLEIGKKSEMKIHKSLESIATDFVLDYSHAPSVWDVNNCYRWQSIINHNKSSSEGIEWVKKEGWQITENQWTVIRELTCNREDIIYWRTVFTDTDFWVPPIYKYETKIRNMAIQINSCDISQISSHIKSINDPELIEYTNSEIGATIRRALTGKIDGPKIHELLEWLPPEFIYKRLQSHKSFCMSKV